MAFGDNGKRALQQAAGSRYVRARVSTVQGLGVMLAVNVAHPPASLLLLSTHTGCEYSGTGSSGCEYSGTGRIAF